MRFHVDRINAMIGTAARCHRAQLFLDILSSSFKGPAPLLPRQFKPLGNIIEGDHPACTQQEGAANRELPNRAATPHGDSLTRLNTAILSRHEAGGKDVC
jgi:hypothetical protein